MHEEAVDGAVVQATAVRRALLTDNTVSGFDSIALLDELIGVVQTKAMRERLMEVKREYELLLNRHDCGADSSGGGAGGKEVLYRLDRDYEIDKSVLERLVLKRASRQWFRLPDCFH